jgi:hypothetical protein
VAGGWLTRWMDCALPQVSPTATSTRFCGQSLVGSTRCLRNDSSDLQTLVITLHKASSRRTIVPTIAIERMVVPPATTTSGVEIPSQESLTPR